MNRGDRGCRGASVSRNFCPGSNRDSESDRASTKPRVDNRHVQRDECGCIWDAGEKAVLCDWHKYQLKLKKRREQYANRKKKTIKDYRSKR